MSRVLWTASCKTEIVRAIVHLRASDSTQAVVPIFSAVANGLMFESPMSKMQPPIFAIIGQRLVARIDDGAIELHPLVDVVHDVIGALADLEIDLRLRAAAVRNRRRADSPDRPGPHR